MGELSAFLEKLGLNVLGETLRAITFVGEGLGCYSNFTVRSDATPRSRQEIEAFIEEYFDGLDDNDFLINEAQAYTFKEGSLTVDVFWVWGGDGTLYFRVKEGEKTIREIINSDCKKDQWEELEDPAHAMC